MSRSVLIRRLVILETSRTGHQGITPAWARGRVEELRIQGREDDETPSEWGALFSPRQLCRMVGLQRETL